MKRFILLALLSMLLSIPISPISTFSDKSWELVFYDDFNGPTLNTDVWNTVPRTGRVDPKGKEFQYYADDAFEFKDGILRIKAEKRYVEGCSYTSGLIDTRNIFSQKYGYFEIRARMPKGQGFWPGFWLLPEKKWPPEIDVFEYLGHETNVVYLSNHWANAEGQHDWITEEYTGPDFSMDFHTFAIEWTPKEIIWYVDGKEARRTDQGVPSEPMFIIANLVIGGDWPGDPDETTPFPSYLEIDYIRIYQRSNVYMTFLPGILRR